ncbi:hypothetical protein [Actinoplanes subtropicus]|uniref:hypothetical protein n=1 Tax=Actinoplanes subtropicus TaxID=543632 RepID=UPI0004C37CB4|nr:hypothetical protein [Actinoplanes subtropicus]
MSRSVFARAAKLPPPTPHTGWCARDHRCTGALHQSPPIIADTLGGRAVITRVKAGDVEYADIRARVPLTPAEPTAHRQLGLTLHLIRRLFAAVAALRPETLPTRPTRPALDRRPAA